MRNILALAASLLIASVQLATTLKLDVTKEASIKSTAKTIASGMIKYYTGDATNTPETLGILPPPYYWWEAGAMWGAMIDYYQYTGDSTYNEITTQALLSQVGPNYDFVVPRQASNEGNDDQAFWGFAAMAAAEKDYPQPTVGGYSWGQLVENLWNTQARRWDTETCGGGLKWQFNPANAGYEYKNSVSNGAFFQLSARLARFTGNQTYAEWAEKVYDWTMSVNLIDDENNLVYDGADDTTDCSTIDRLVWTYNTAIFMYGSAIMYNYTNGSSVWEGRTQGFLYASAVFFSPFKNATNVMFEQACETVWTCNTDQVSFKAYMSRFMWATTLVAPFSQGFVAKYLVPSAQAASKACSGGTDGVTCGTRWYYAGNTGWDGQYGVGQQMSALEVIQGLLINKTAPPLYSNQVQVMGTKPTMLPSDGSSTATATTAKHTSPVGSGTTVDMRNVLSAAVFLTAIAALL